MANPFEAAAAKASKPGSKKKKKNDNIMVVRDSDVVEAINRFVQAHAAMKQAESEKEVASAEVTPYCRAEWLRQCAELGRPPESSPKFSTPDGSTVTFIAQDRGGRYEVSQEQMDTFIALLGEKKAKQIVEQQTIFKFNSDVLAKDGVMAALGAKISELVEEGVLTSEEAGELLEAEAKSTVRKGTLADLAKLCDSDPDQMDAVLGALGSHASNYIKA